MNKIIDIKDMELLEAMAQKYNLTTVELGKTIVNQLKKRNERQFRVSEKEFEKISQNAERNGYSVLSFCEFACNSFLNNKNLSEEFFGSRRYGEGRTKRISVSFKDANVEKELLEVAERFNIDVGALIRYCALNF